MGMISERAGLLFIFLLFCSRTLNAHTCFGQRGLLVVQLLMAKTFIEGQEEKIVKLAAERESLRTSLQADAGGNQLLQEQLDGMEDELAAEREEGERRVQAVQSQLVDMKAAFEDLQKSSSSLRSTLVERFSQSKSKLEEEAASLNVYPHAAA